MRLTLQRRGSMMPYRFPDFPKHDVNSLNDSSGFTQHCNVAALIINEFGFTPATKHHIRTAIREATHCVTRKRGDRRTRAQFMSVCAQQQVREGDFKELVLEHIVPVSYINQLVLEQTNQLAKDEKKISGDDIATIVLEWACLALITKVEDSRLSRKSVPADINANKFARYSNANPPIPLVENDYKQGKTKGEKFI